MCGRYSNAKDLTELVKIISFVYRLPFTPRYNIAPTQSAPVIVQEKQAPELKLMRWGLTINRPVTLSFCGLDD